jgi:hypothetical protein
MGIAPRFATAILVLVGCVALLLVWRGSSDGTGSQGNALTAQGHHCDEPSDALTRDTASFCRHLQDRLGARYYLRSDPDIDRLTGVLPSGASNAAVIVTNAATRSPSTKGLMFGLQFQTTAEAEAYHRQIMNDLSPIIDSGRINSIWSDSKQKLVVFYVSASGLPDSASTWSSVSGTDIGEDHALLSYGDLFNVLYAEQLCRSEGPDSVSCAAAKEQATTQP